MPSRSARSPKAAAGGAGASARLGTATQAAISRVKRAECAHTDEASFSVLPGLADGLTRKEPRYPEPTGLGEIRPNKWFPRPPEPRSSASDSARCASMSIRHNPHTASELRFAHPGRSAGAWPEGAEIARAFRPPTTRRGTVGAGDDLSNEPSQVCVRKHIPPCGMVLAVTASRADEPLGVGLRHTDTRAAPWTR